MHVDVARRQVVAQHGVVQAAVGAADDHGQRPVVVRVDRVHGRVRAGGQRVVDEGEAGRVGDLGEPVRQRRERGGGGLDLGGAGDAVDAPAPPARRGRRTGCGRCAGRRAAAPPAGTAGCRPAKTYGRPSGPSATWNDAGDVGRHGAGQVGDSRGEPVVLGVEDDRFRSVGDEVELVAVVLLLPAVGVEVLREQRGDDGHGRASRSGRCTGSWTARGRTGRPPGRSSTGTPMLPPYTLATADPGEQVADQAGRRALALAAGHAHGPVGVLGHPQRGAAGDRHAPLAQLDHPRVGLRHARRAHHDVGPEQGLAGVRAGDQRRQRRRARRSRRWTGGWAGPRRRPAGTGRPRRPHRAAALPSRPVPQTATDRPRRSASLMALPRSQIRPEIDDDLVWRVPTTQLRQMTSFTFPGRVVRPRHRRGDVRLPAHRARRRPAVHRDDHVPGARRRPGRGGRRRVRAGPRPAAPGGGRQLLQGRRAAAARSCRRRWGRTRSRWSPPSTRTGWPSTRTATTCRTCSTCAPRCPTAPRRSRPCAMLSGRRPVSAVGGGKDSIVTLEALRDGGFDPVPFAVNPNWVIDEVFAASGLTALSARRALDPALFALNRAGARNGHIPVTAINSLIAVAHRRAARARPRRDVQRALGVRPQPDLERSRGQPPVVEGRGRRGPAPGGADRRTPASSTRTSRCCARSPSCTSRSCSRR